MIPQLRPYQSEAIVRIRQAAQEGSRAILVVSPTGSDKTTIASDLARRSVANGRSVLWLAHRGELVDQAFDRLGEFGLECGVISASSTRQPNPYHPVQVASIQTLLARNLRPKADVIVWDECHHTVSDLWSGLASDYRASTLIGFTATPERSDGRGLAAVYSRIVVAARVRELVALGHLVPTTIERPGRKLRNGSIAQRPVDAWQKHARGRHAIVFSPSVIAAQQHAAEFVELGVSAEVLTGTTPAAVRSEMLARFKNGELLVLVNVMVLTEGFDAPETSCIILARSCGTAGTYLQMAGRGLRPAPGKRDCVLIDLHGVSHVLDHPEDDREYSLEGKGIRSSGADDVDPGTSCRVCGAPTVPGEPCPDCGTEPKEIKAPEVTGDPLVRYAAKRAESDDRRAATLARWIAVGIDKGWKSGASFHKYRAVYGAQPTAAITTAARAMLAEMGRAA